MLSMIVDSDNNRSVNKWPSVTNYGVITTEAILWSLHVSIKKLCWNLVIQCGSKNWTLLYFHINSTNIGQYQ